jgi:hypothetical protein
MANSTTLSDRIASAINGSPSSIEIAALLTEARAQCESLTERKAKLRALALHPTTPAAEVKAARGKIDDASFDQERMEIAVESLEAMLKRVEASEQHAARVAAYKAAKAERDAIAADLARIYPEAAKAIADVLTRVARSNEIIAKINADIPDGCEWMADVEHVARGVMGNGGVIAPDGTRHVGMAGHLVSAVKLPHLSGVDALQMPRGYWGKGGSFITTENAPASAVA